MMSLRRIFGLMLLFFFFEAVVAVVTTFAYPDVNVFLACVAMTGLAVGVWAVFVLMTRIMTRPRAPQPPPMAKPVNPVNPRPSFGDDGFTQELNALIAEANRRLIGAQPPNARGEPPTVATLPLYLVIGGEGAGKTSAILNSGMEPRLLAGEAAREGTVIPTRLCNLWFAESAVFADISGRVVAQEAENWERALRVFSQPFRIPRWKQVLFGRRSQTNLRGLVLVCDASQFARVSDPQRTGAFAKTLSDRLQTAGSVFRREFPVYVVFSKCDGVQYFSEFFAHLSEPEGRRLLGTTLPFAATRNDTADIYADREGRRLTGLFNRLYMSLAEKRLVLLTREDEPAKRSAAYEFPRELKKLRGDVVQFLLDVFRPNLLPLGPRLRGFYLSGQRWVARNLAPAAEGSVGGFTVVPRRSDATVFFGSKPGAQPAAGLGPVRASGTGGAIAKWIFLADLFHNVILKDRAGSVAPPTQTREEEYRNFAIAGAGAFLLLLCLLWANSWRHNRELLNTVQTSLQGVHRYRSDTSSYGGSFTDLDLLRTPLVTLLEYDRHGPPLSYRWGLYSGHDITGSLSELYFERFRKLVMDPSLSSLTTLFLGLGSNAPVADDVYDLLKTYRMVTSGECKPDAGFLGSTLLPIWANAASVSPSDVGALAQDQLQFYISELLIRNPYERDIRENSKAVEQARAYLREQHGPDKILQGLIDTINHERKADALSNYPVDFVDVLIGPVTVDAAFTRDGWGAMMDDIHGHKSTSAGEACVVGGKTDESGLSFNSEDESQVKGLYVDRFIQKWKSFLEAHHVQPFQSSRDAAQKLRLLADNNHSALLGLVYMGAHNTDLAPPEKSTTEAATEVVKKKIETGLGGLFGSKPGTAVSSAVTQELAPAGVRDASDVVRAFAPLKFVVDPANRDKWISPNNQGYIQALEELAGSMDALPAMIDTADPQSQQAADHVKNAIALARAAHHKLGGTIPNTSSGVDTDLMALLKEPIDNAETVYNHIPRKGPVPVVDLIPGIKRGVNESAKVLCNSLDGLRAKYPFNLAATEEAMPQDLNTVFAPSNGTLAQFAQNHDVQQAFQHQGQTWVPNAVLTDVEFMQTFVHSLNALSAFQAALYPDEGGNPHFEYAVTLNGTGRFWADLAIDGQALSFGMHGGILYTVDPFLHKKKPHPSAKLFWPPTSYQPTTLSVKAGQEVKLEERGGTWSLVRLLQEADKQEGGLFVFNNIRAGSNLNPLTDGHGNPVQILIHIDSPAAAVFGKGYFGKLRCENFTGLALR